MDIEVESLFKGIMSKFNIISAAHLVSQINFSLEVFQHSSCIYVEALRAIFPAEPYIYTYAGLCTYLYPSFRPSVRLSVT